MLIDTLEYAESLTAIGLTGEQAAGQAKALQKAIATASDGQLASKDDIQSVRLDMSDIRSEIGELRGDMKVIKYTLGLLVIVVLMPVLERLAA